MPINSPQRIHRLSIGVQSFDDGLLTQMNRYDKYGSGEWILQRLQEMVWRLRFAER